MKKTFLITSAIAFGVTSAFIIASVVMMATGMIKRNIFGGYTFAFESSSASKSVSDYDNIESIVKGLVITNATIADTDDPRMKKVIFEVENPNADLNDELVRFNVVFNKSGKVVKVVDAVESLTIKSKEKQKVMMDLIMKESFDYDSIELMPQG